MTSPSTAGAGLVLEDLEITAMAHGGEGIGRSADGRVVFVAGTVPGDTVTAQVTKSKKRWARAELMEVTAASDMRVDPACPAAAMGAGCCDYSHIAPAAQLGLKLDVLRGQLTSLARNSAALEGFDLDTSLSAHQLEPVRGWRTRVRLGVDAAGRAGLRQARSNEVVHEVTCTQAAPGLLAGLVGEGARTFTPGAEVVAVLDSTGTRHVVETTRAQRGRRVERIDTVIDGSGTVTEQVGEYTFSFPSTAFWQAHVAAPERYAAIVAEWGAGSYARKVGWDLYGGVGVFAPYIARAIGGGRVESVDYSPAASASTAELDGVDMVKHNRKVEAGFADLEQPGLVVLDPPRSGAGAEVIGAVVNAAPERIIHVGCDPATFARDLGLWGEGGYKVARMELIDAFPGTHHFETIALLEPAVTAAAQ
ncbi:class I SAM-dependent RNA methyltransferase [Corynebacterium sp. LK2510]|uniref:class I SAM-dependent RNA methyltransferase n=1 Tax=Corynebacterium sp. LK2510 TaxID=3110472 RepID=UPI0034CFF48A